MSDEYSPGFTVTTKQERPEIWQATAELRWLDWSTPSFSNHPMPSRSYNCLRTLQQLHRSTTGRTEWRDVPVVTE